VGIAGTPSVSIAGTPSVNATLTGTPSVNATISGTPSVSISGTPTVSATIAGTPSVSISGTPTVNVANGLTINSGAGAVALYAIDGRQNGSDFTIGFAASLSSGDYVVPSGKRLVVDSLYFYLGVVGGTLGSVKIRHTPFTADPSCTGNVTCPSEIWFTPTPTAFTTIPGAQAWIFSGPFPIFFDAGDSPTIALNLTQTTAGFGISPSITLYGHLAAAQ
jgi:hypothetical protein